MSERTSMFLSGFTLGVGLVTFLMCAFTDATSVWQKQAIEHNAARYNATTGKFEWIERSDGK